MNQSKIVVLVALALIGIVLVSTSVYVVDQREKAIVVRIGHVIRVDDAPGLHFKAPFVDSVRFFDARILTLDFNPEQVLTVEKKYVLVDYFVKWRILDPLKYYLTASGLEVNARSRLRPIVESGLKDEFGTRTLQDAISSDRSKIMEDLRVKADQSARDLGIQVVDVRIQRVDLPDKVSHAVYQRMEAERARIASQYRAEGAEANEKIRAEAERQRDTLVAEGYGQAQKIRGEGDSRATTIYASAYGQAPEFYAFYRSLNAYKESFKNKSDIMIVDPSSDFFKYMKKPTR
jgi:membrane protease subunit HflC